MRYRLLIILALASFGANAQLIHVAGSKAIGFDGGYVTNGFNVSSRLSFYHKSDITFRGSFDYEGVKFKLSNAYSLTVNPDVMYTFRTFGENFFLSAKAGLITGAEFLSNSILDKSKSQFVIGENIGLCAEYYASSKIMLNLDIDQRFFQMSKLGNASFIVKLGVNYNF